MYYDSQPHYNDLELYYDDPEPYPDDLEPYYDNLELSCTDGTCDYENGPEQHHDSMYDIDCPPVGNFQDGAELDDRYHEDQAAWDGDRYALTETLDYGGEEEEVYLLGDEVAPLGAASWHADNDADPHAVDYGESTAWGRAWMDGPSPGECPEVWEASMVQWRDHILATHDVAAGEVLGSEADNGVPTPEADTVWMAPELAELQAALQRGDIPVAEQEQLEHTLAELWADELEHQRAVSAGYTWDEERGDYWHPLHGYTADEEEGELPTCHDESEVAEELPPPSGYSVITPIIAQVSPASPDTPAPMWQRVLSVSPSLPRRPRSPHRHRTAILHLSKSSLHKRAASAPTKRKARRIVGSRASSCPGCQRDRPPHLPAIDSDAPLSILHPPSLSLPSPKIIVVPHQPGPRDIPCPSSVNSSAVLIVDPGLSPTPSDPVSDASTLLLAPSAQRRRNALRRLAKKGKG